MSNQKPVVRKKQFENTYTDKNKQRYMNINATSKDLLYKKVATKFNTTKANAKRVLDKQLTAIEKRVINTPKYKQPLSSTISMKFFKGEKEVTTTCIAYKSTKGDDSRYKEKGVIRLQNSWELKCHPHRKK